MVERGLGSGGVTEGRGVLCRIVTSFATLSSVPASSSHSWQVSVTARFCCVWVGGGSHARFWVAAGGEGGVGSSHALCVRAISFSLCFLGGGGEERARGEEREEGG